MGARTRGVGCAAAMAALAWSACLAASGDPLKKWTDGPIRYIITPEEQKIFAQLKDDPSRAAFIYKFWARRDPTPKTLANEYRHMFWERVRDANEKFTDSSSPGWKTDRGKIYILYGPPTEIREDPNAETGGLPAAGQGLIRWIYEGRPGNRRDMDPIVVVPFVRDLTGEYRVSSDPKLASVYFDWQSTRDEDTKQQWERWFQTFFPSGRTDLAVMLDLGKMQEVPPEEAILLERVETFETYATHPLAVEIDRYPSPDAGERCLVVLTIGVPASAPTEPAVIARFSPRDATARPRILAEGSFRLEGSGAERVIQGRLRLDPGTYDLTVMAADPEAVSNGIFHGVVTVPGHDDRLGVSDVCLARVLEPVAYASLASYDEPYSVGAFRVIPRVDAALRRGDPLQLFYEIHGGKPPYTVSYRLEGKEDNGSWTALGRPVVLEQAEAAQGWTLPTSAMWPLGDYRARIEIRDDQGAAASATVPFALAGAAEPVPAGNARPGSGS